MRALATRGMHAETAKLDEIVTMNPFDEFRPNVTRRHFFAAGSHAARHGGAGVADRRDALGDAPAASRRASMR